jgi:hypothetical protein
MGRPGRQQIGPADPSLCSRGLTDSIGFPSAASEKSFQLHLFFQDMYKKTWLISRTQIAAGDVENSILSVDPEQIPEAEIFGLQGAIRLRIEGARGMADVITDPAARKFFRALHARWPWAGFFLRLRPINAASVPDEIVDLSVFMSLLLVRVDRLTFVETPHGTALRHDADQLCEHLFDLQSRAAQLAAIVDLPPTAINQRAALISRAVASFFEAGEALHQTTKTKRNKRK